MCSLTEREGQSGGRPVSQVSSTAVTIFRFRLSKDDVNVRESKGKGLCASGVVWTKGAVGSRIFSELGVPLTWGCH